MPVEERTTHDGFSGARAWTRWRQVCPSIDNTKGRNRGSVRDDEMPRTSATAKRRIVMDRKRKKGEGGISSSSCFFVVVFLARRDATHLSSAMRWRRCKTSGTGERAWTTKQRKPREPLRSLAPGHSTRRCERGSAAHLGRPISCIFLHVYITLAFSLPYLPPPLSPGQAVGVG